MVVVVYCDTREKKDVFVKQCIEHKYHKILIAGSGGSGKTYSANKLRDVFGTKLMTYSFDWDNCYEKCYSDDRSEVNVSYDMEVYTNLDINENEFKLYDIVAVYSGDESIKH